mgnify:CR=1 FL=1
MIQYIMKKNQKQANNNEEEILEEKKEEKEAASFLEKNRKGNTTIKVYVDDILKGTKEINMNTTTSVVFE